jgi:multiple antibiotic resistance protein
MGPEAVFFVNCFVTLFSILDPFGAAAILLSLTPGHDDARRARMVGRTMRVTVGILALFALAGGRIFGAFGISISALMVAGGIILANLALKMLHGEEITEGAPAPEGAPPDSRDDVAIIPMAMPLLAGPAAISSVTVFAHRTAGVEGYVSLFAAIFLSTFLSYLILLKSQKIADALGYNGMRVMVRIMGLILLAMGAEFVLSGVKEYFR